MTTARKFLNSLIKELNYSSFCEIGYHNGETTEAINLSNDQKVSVDPSPDISTKYINGFNHAQPLRNRLVITISVFFFMSVKRGCP